MIHEPPHFPAFQLQQLFRQYTFASSTEDELQRAVAQCLDMNQIAYMREVRVSQTDRPDFLLDTVAIEIKIGGSLSEVTRQIHRYAQRDDIQEVLLVTTCAKHLDIPDEFNGKPIVTLCIGVAL
ncbi:MAG TPA: hypothetical protein VGQ12_08105 [Candidatus Angelobacter sp.]|jgi:hypothetical protein|nr:hypothetical protein [Candidatus Angelobacter sp.]